MLPLATSPVDPSLPVPDNPLPAQEMRKEEEHASVVCRRRKATGSMRERRVWLVVLALCVSLGLSESALAYWCYDADKGPLSLSRALGLGLGMWYSWALLWLIAWPLARSFQLDQAHWRSRLVLHGTASIVCVMLKILCDYLVFKYCFYPLPHRLTFAKFLDLMFTACALRYILYYWAMIGVSHAVDYFYDCREGQLRTAQLETGLARARLQLLKTQLQPHFLFNTLNAISALVHVDVEAADRILARLGELLRLSLEDFAAHEAPLARELEIARSYLEIEQARLGPRLRTEWDIAPDSGDALVPTLILQPLIENAIRHGIAPRTGPGCILIRTWRLGTELHLEVRDDGPGLPSSAKTGGGASLANTRTRLANLYGTAQRLEISTLPEGGCTARIVLPFRELPGELRDTKLEVS